MRSGIEQLCELGLPLEILLMGFDSVSAAMLITDANGLIQLVNRDYERITGLEREHVIGKPPSVHSSGLHQASHYRLMWRELRKGNTWSGNFLNRRGGPSDAVLAGEPFVLDEECYWMKATLTPLLSTDGQLAVIVALQEVITKEMLHRTQANRRRECITLQASFATLLSGTGTLQPRINEGMELIFNLTNAPFLRRWTIVASDLQQVAFASQELRMPEHFPEGHFANWVTDPTKLCKLGNCPHERDPNGLRMPPHGHYWVPIPSSDGVMGGLLLLTREDISLDQEVEAALVILGELISNAWFRDERAKELLSAQKEANAASKAKSDFLANMSHEIRTPMNGVLGMTEMLLETGLNEIQLDCAKTIQSSGEGMLSIINDILDFSKIEAGKMTAELLEFDLVPVLEDAVSLLSSKARGGEIELTLEFQTRLPNRIESDPGRLRQILLNLLSNAVKFTKTGGVRVVVKHENERLRIDVIDTGIGVSEEAQKRLFESFSQADESTTRIYGGTGLGLSISLGFAEILGGAITIESELGKGATFSLEIEAPTKDPHTSTAIPGTPRALVGIEAPMTRASVRGELEALGFEVTEQPGDKGIALAILDANSKDAHGAPPTIRLVSKPTEGRTLIWPPLPSAIQKQVLRCLPSPKSPLPKPNEPVAEVEGPPTLDLRILVAEDNKINQKVISHLLGKLGADFTIVNNGREALDAVLCGSFDVVLMDCQMPVLDGWRATEAIRRLPKGKGRIPIIALTAGATIKDHERCLEAGMDSILTKPVRIEDLHERLRSVSVQVD